MKTLLDDIESFITRHGVAESAFGRKAVNDWRLVRSLRDGRRVWPETEIKVRSFMEAFEADVSSHVGITQHLRDGSRKSDAA